MTISVTYTLTDEEAKRLDHITDLFNQATGKPHTPEQTFSAIMRTGSARDIKDKLDYAELNFSANIRMTA